MSRGQPLRHFQELLEAATAARSPEYARQRRALRRVRHAVLKAGEGKPPVELPKLAQQLGVSAIRTAPLATAGRLRMTSEGLVVEVDCDLTVFDSQLAVAHELAHVILEGEDLVDRARLGYTPRALDPEGLAELERLCDLAAEEILLPAGWVRDRVGLARPALSRAQAIADESGCPVTFVVGRLVQLGRWTVALYALRDSDGLECLSPRCERDIDTSELEAISSTMRAQREMLVRDRPEWLEVSTQEYARRYELDLRQLDDCELAMVTVRR